MLQDLEAWAKAQKVKLDEATKAALRPHLAADKPVLALTFRPKKAGRGLRLPAIQWTGRPAPLDLDLAADQTSPGQVLSVHLVLADVAGTATPDAPVVDLGTGISLPEVVFEAPRDLFRAAVAHALRREARPALLRVHADVAARP